ncbi:A/G-specific adenine glycosylase [Salinibacillus kushneri]|uniref:Adenine DNA glycosylase n=1 Tax=Salinibacillus kushneri TaxID=237682 RepID=A0A1I0GLV0_9BACI|nr:A/G-specific adenine glycosylase [Salinibacillus kushneri]SET71189.1 A/G-specific adenine glycosylase [Salinibacillus kushneri]
MYDYQSHLEELDIQAFKTDLIQWFKEVHRNLPWRHDPTPYHVWVSEIMLQQTKVDTVIPYYHRFMEKFPTPEALAKADEQDVLKVWEGLGYYSRARNLQTAVREVVEEYNGKVPDNPKELGKLKGVGPYTKGAILSIAFQEPIPAVDGNVMRVISRILRIEEDIAKAKTRKIFEGIITEIISQHDPSSFNQGLMELGALVCKPKNPVCHECPLQVHCQAYKHDLQQTLPIKSTSKAQKTKRYAVLMIRNDNGEILVQKRPEKGLLANLWQFPMIPLDEMDFKNLIQWFRNEYGLELELDKKVTNIKHVFSHLVWQLEVYSATVKGGHVVSDKGIFLDYGELIKLPFPVSHQKIIQLI